MSSNGKGVINFIKDSSGEIISLDQALGSTTAYNSGSVAIPALATSLLACATLPETVDADGNTAIKNPLCTEESLVTRIVEEDELVPLAACDVATAGTHFFLSRHPR